MKRKILYIIIAAFASLLPGACTKDFENINVDPSIVTDVDVRFLFTSSLEAMQTYRTTEWVYEDMEHFMTVCQLVTCQSYEVSGVVNSRYSVYYSSVLPNLFEMRRVINGKTDKEKYQQINAVTYIVQVLMGLKVTDVVGSMPYTEANQGREFGKYDPKYDNQQTLYTTWLDELNNVIQVLESNLADQVTFGNNDIFYKGDITKWIKLANTLKLRIATRYQLNDPVKATQIFKEVMTDSFGPFSSTADQMTYDNPTWYPFSSNGYNVDIRSRHFAVETVIDFMKSTEDPRLGIYYDKNSLTGNFKDTLTKYGKTLPAWCDLNDPNIMYQGGPADFQSIPEKSTYFVNPFDGGGGNRYQLISNFNRKFFAPTIDGGVGDVVDVLVSYAEVCFYVAEFIQKGYGAGFDTKGTAAEWYEKGIRASAKTMNEIAIAAGSTSYSNIDPLVDTYLANSKIALDGNNNLEKIYIQELLNFYRNANEAYTMVRRTGYPKFNSTLLAREPESNMLPRRWWLLDPGEVNSANWSSAMAEEGFTPNDHTMLILSTERIWFDKDSPEFGEGN
jgi:hypothetical protein